MAEENDTDDVADEMMRMMAEEAGDGGETAPDTADAASGDADDDLEAQMLQSMQDEMSSDAAPAAGGDDLESQMIQAMASETGASTETTTAAIQHLGGLSDSISAQNIRRVLDVKISVSIELGNTSAQISTVLHWAEGSLIELDVMAGEPVKVIVNNKPYARGEVVVIAENFGVRLTEISPEPARQRNSRRT